MRRYYYYDDYYETSRPIEVKDGIKAKTKKGQSFGSTWWSKKWVEVLESFGWANRLQRGRTYARKGQVIDIDIKKGKVASHVQGSRPKPYKIEIEMKQISDKDWGKALDTMAEQAIFAAKLLAGEMPYDIEDAFKSADVRLFPLEKDIKTDCSCPDWANPCKHIAAVYYILGERFDADPFLIFLLRGRSKEEIMEMLRSRRSAYAQTSDKTDEVDANVAPAAVVGESYELIKDYSFWELKSPIDDLRIGINPPDVDMAILKRLGEPSFWDAKKRFSEFLKPVYTAVSDSVRYKLLK